MKILKNLTDIYKNQDELSDLVMQRRKEVGDLPNLFDHVVVGRPLVVDDPPLYDLYEGILFGNTHFVPGKIPAIGITAGAFLRQNEKEYITVHDTVSFLNIAFLHMARNCEDRIIAWDGIKKQVNEDHAELCQLIQKSKPDFIRKFVPEGGIDLLNDNCNLNWLDTPSTTFVNNLRGMVHTLHNRAAGDIVQKANSLIVACTPYIGIGNEMREMQLMFDGKGHSVFNGTHFGISQVSTGNGYPWFQLVSESAADALPSTQELLFLVNNGQSITPDSARNRSTIFLVPPSALSKLQEIVNVSPELRGEWYKFMYLSGEDPEKFAEKCIQWQNKVDRVFAKDHVRVKEIIESVLHDQVLGFQLDMINNEGGEAALRPVISRTHLNKHAAELFAAQGPDIMEARFEEVLFDLNDQYRKPESIFSGVAEESIA